VNACVLLLAFAVLNDQYQFFSSWQDLLGTGSNQVAVSTGGGGVAVAVRQKVHDPLAGVPVVAASPVQHVDGGTVYRLTGAVSGVTSTVMVQLPPGYTDPVNRSRTYPVLMGFAGFPGTVTQMASVFDVAANEQRLVAAHELGPAINVYPLAWSPPNRDTECVDGPRSAAPSDQYETWAAVDVPAWVRSTFRASTHRSSWATWGMSAGAWCADMITMLHPGTFSAAISLGGYFKPSWLNWYPYAAGDPAMARYDLVALSRRDPPPVALWLFATRGDPFAFPETDQLLAQARAPLSITSHILPTGGHRVSVWTPWFPVALSWLGRSIPGFAAAHP
jgi:S-formylglutathione hydrolase FrmB